MEDYWARARKMRLCRRIQRDKRRSARRTPISSVTALNARILVRSLSWALTVAIITGPAVDFSGINLHGGRAAANAFNRVCQPCLPYQLSATVL